MARKVVGTALGVALLLAGCAGLASHQSGSQPQPLTVDRSRSGDTINMVAGQHLIVRLGESWRTTKEQKPSIQYPTDLLSFSSAKAASGTYIFDAHRRGVGRLLILAPGCRPGPMAGPGAAVCPVVGAAKPKLGANEPAWVFVLTIRITPA